MNEKKHRILIAEDHDIARLGLRLTLQKMPDIEIVGEAIDGDSVLAQTEQFHPSIILMDVNLPGISGIQATKIIKGAHRDISIIMFTSDSSDETVFAALGAGADGYCLKNISAQDLRTAIDSVSRGAAWLDPAIAQRVLQAQVAARSQSQVNDAVKAKEAIDQGGFLDEQQLKLLELIQKGVKLEQIAVELNLSPASVEDKLRSILGGLSPIQTNQSSMQRSTIQSGSSAPTVSTMIKPGFILAGRFSIEDTLGSGGVSTVYRGKDLSIGRTVAIKMLQQQPLKDEKEIQRFLQEAKAASAVSHPNVITIFDFGVTSEGQPYMVMDYIDGDSLDELMKIQQFSLARILSIFIQVCDALSAAHKKNIIHRDLKPSNIMLLKNDDGEDVVKLVDFGMAKFLLESEDLKLSKTGDLFGTPLYMSPEHFKGKKLDARSDIYGLGCALYEALTGTPPFNGASLYELMSYHVNEEPSKLPFLRPGKKIPQELESLLFKMLAKDPEERPQTMAEIKSELSKISQMADVSK